LLPCCLPWAKTRTATPDKKEPAGDVGRPSAKLSAFFNLAPAGTASRARCAVSVKAC